MAWGDTAPETGLAGPECQSQPLASAVMTRVEAAPPEGAPLPWGTRLPAAARAAMTALATPKATDAVSTGFIDLDSITGGLHPGDLWVVAGRSGVGKSVFGRDLVRSATRTRRGCLHASRDASPEDVAVWLLAAEARVPLIHLVSGAVPEANWARLQEARMAVEDAPVVLSRTDGSDLGALTGRLADMGRASPHPCMLVVIDDLPALAGQVRTVRAAREFAQSHGVAVVVVVQDDLNDLQLQARRLEQLADVLLRLHREDQGVRPTLRAGEADLLVTRNRRGPTGTITLAFQGHYGRFVNL